MATVISKSFSFSFKSLRQPVVVAAFVFGILADFLVSGIFKLIWVAIYAPTHLAIAMTIGSYCLHSRYRKLSILVSLSYIFGMAVSHLYFQNHASLDTYGMKLETPPTETPLAFSSVDFTEMLFVTSQPLGAKLSGASPGAPVLMTAKVVKDYGCLQSIDIQTVAGVDVATDPADRWNWRITQIGIRQSDDVPPLFSHRWPWCGFHLDQMKAM